MLAPLINCITGIDHALLQAMPVIELQFINIMNFRLVDLLPHFSRNFVVNWVQIWTIGGWGGGK